MLKIESSFRFYLFYFSSLANAFLVKVRLTLNLLGMLRFECNLQMKLLLSKK